MSVWFKTNLFQSIQNGFKRYGNEMEAASRNITRADIPDEKPQVVKGPSFAQTLSVTGVACTHPNHINGRGTSISSDFKIITDPKASRTISGNYIDAHQETQKFGQALLNHLQTQKQMESAKKRLQTVLTLGKGG